MTPTLRRLPPHASRLLPLAYCLLAPAILTAQTAAPFSWDADSHPPQTAIIQAWRGDTIPLAPRFGTANTNAWTFTTYWSTNPAAWWSKGRTPGKTITGNPFLWTPDMDCGARKYRLFIQAGNTGGASYRANADIHILDSPGTNPADLPPAGQWPAIAGEILSILTPSLPTYDTWIAESLARAYGDVLGSNHVWAVQTNLQSQIDNLDLSGSGGGDASSAGTALRLTSPDGEWFVSVTAGTATLWRVTHVPSTAWFFEHDYNGGFTGIVSNLDYPSPDNFWFDLGGATVSCYTEDPYDHYSEIRFEDYGSLWGTTDPANGLTCADDIVTARLYRAPTQNTTTNAAGTFTTAADLTNALASFNPAAATNALAWATNAWLRAGTAITAATNADARITAATNAIVQRYFVSSNAWITADFSNSTVAVTLISPPGTTNTVTVGDASGDAIDPEATNLLWIALNSGLSAIDGKADKAWGKYAPDGSLNPDPGFMTFINSPALVHGAGFQWATYGTAAFLCSSGTVAFAAGVDGEWRMGPDLSSNWFGYVRGGSVLVGAIAQRIDYNMVEMIANITYPYEGGDFPTVWFTPSLALGLSSFQPLVSVVWIDNLDGTATVNCSGNAPAGYYYATTSQSLDASFVSKMPARFDGGVFGSTNALPVKYDSTITITSGGKTYRIPAQLTE